HRQRNAVHLFAVHGNSEPAGHHPSANGVSSSGRQQLHRAVSPQLEGRRSLGARISKYGRGAQLDRPLDSRVQSRTPSPKSQKSNASRGVPSLASYTTFRGPKCPTLRGSLHAPYSYFEPAQLR